MIVAAVGVVIIVRDAVRSDMKVAACAGIGRHSPCLERRAGMLSVIMDIGASATILGLRFRRATVLLVMMLLLLLLMWVVMGGVEGRGELRRWVDDRRGRASGL